MPAGSGRVVVITGASSGIGRAIALRLARRGDRVVLAARRAEALDEVAREIASEGGEALAVPTDVTHERAVEALARRTVERFGRVDVWVNCAAVSLYARFDEAPSEAFRRVIETDVFGYVHGARAALSRFRAQGHGALVNVASAVADLPQPYTSAYVMSKHAVRALSACIRQELLLDRADDIHVVTVFPPSIDTPLFQHAANYTGAGIEPIPPIYAPEEVARAIERGLDAPRREIYVGVSKPLMHLGPAVAPKLVERRMARTPHRRHLDHGRYTDPTEGNLFRPAVGTGAVHGGWNGRPRRTRALVLGGAALAATLGAVWAGSRAAWR